MKKLIIFLGLFLTAEIPSFSQSTATDSIHFSKTGTYIIDSIPRAIGWVSDYEKLYTKEEANYLDSILSAFEKKTGYEIAIITVDGSLTTDSSFDDYIINTANAWGVGKKGNDNGMVIGISSEFGRVRIVNGSGITQKLPDATTKQIMETIFFAKFREGKFFDGTKEGILAIMDKLK